MSTISAIDLESVAQNHRPYFASIANRVVKNYGDVDDVLQNSFLLAWRDRKLFKGECPLKMWVARIVRSQSLNYIRGRRHYEPLAELSDWHLASMIPTPERLYANKQKRELFRSAVNSIMEPLRPIVWAILNDDKLTEQMLRWKHVAMADLSVAIGESRHLIYT